MWAKFPKGLPASLFRGFMRMRIIPIIILIFGLGLILGESNVVFIHTLSNNKVLHSFIIKYVITCTLVIDYVIISTNSMRGDVT